MKIHRIELPTIFGMKTVNSFVKKGDEVVLIDCGEATDQSYHALVVGLKEIGLTLSDIDRIILTHAHVDHMGMAERIAVEAKAEVWVNDITYDWAVRPSEMWSDREKIMMPSLTAYFEESVRPFIMQGYQEMMGTVKDVWLPIHPDHLRKFDKEGKLEIDGEIWDVWYMPGHSQTQSTFYHSFTASYLSADMLLKITPTPVIERSLENPSERSRGIHEMMKSYERLLQRDIHTVYPGHYEAFVDCHQMINNQVNRINKRCEETFKLIAKGIYSFFELYQQLYAGRLSMPAMIMMIAYLDLLEKEERIVVEEENGVFGFHAVS